MKVAIIHDWLECYAGAERVLAALIEIYPNADLYTLVDFMPEPERTFLKGKIVNTSFIQHLPFSKKHFRKYLGLMPLAIEQFNLSAYDLIVSSSHAFAKGVITGANQIHVSYVHTPIRYAWDLMYQYLQQSNLEKGGFSWIVRALLHYIRLWDYRTAHSVDYFIANSNYIAKRIYKTYRRPAEVIYPPVDTERFFITHPICKRDNFYVTAQRIVPYKRVDLIVNTFNQMPDKNLIVIGNGTELEKIKKSANKNITFLDMVEQTTLINYLQRAKAFVFAAEEDFGIAPVEAQACGTPVIAYGRGGATETVQAYITGLFFEKQTEAALCSTIHKFETLAEKNIFSAEIIRKHALKFSKENHIHAMQHFLKSIIPTSPNT